MIIPLNISNRFFINLPYRCPYCPPTPPEQCIIVEIRTTTTILTITTAYSCPSGCHNSSVTTKELHSSSVSNVTVVDFNSFPHF